MTLIVRR